MRTDAETKIKQKNEFIDILTFLSTGWPNKNCTFFEIPYFLQPLQI